MSSAFQKFLVLLLLPVSGSECLRWKNIRSRTRPESSLTWLRVSR